MKPVFRVLGAADGLVQSLVGRARRLTKIERGFHALLDPEARIHCRVANLYRDTLVVYAESPAWAARLRYLAPQLVRDLHRLDPTLGTVRTLKIRVRPNPAPAAHSRRRAPEGPRMTASTAAFIASVAETTADPGLKRVLARLAARARQDADEG